MKIKVTEDKILKDTIITGLRENDGHCPCIYESKGKPQYKCWCEEFRTKVAVVEYCHCGLFMKVSD